MHAAAEASDALPHQLIERYGPFETPSFTSPLDPGPYYGSVPAGATMLGIFFNSILNSLGKQREAVAREFGPYRPLTHYPLLEMLKLHVTGAKHLHPTLPLRAALRQTGRSMFPALFDSLAGRAVFGAFRNRIDEAFPYAPRALMMSMTGVEAEVLEKAHGEAVMSIRNDPVFLDAHVVGIVEGALEFMGARRQRVQIQSRGVLDAVFHCAWSYTS